VLQTIIPQEENLSPMEYIHSQDFQAKIEGPFKSNVSKLLIDFFNIVVTSSEQLSLNKIYSNLAYSIKI